MIDYPALIGAHTDLPIVGLQNTTAGDTRRLLRRSRDVVAVLRAAGVRGKAEVYTGHNFQNGTHLLRPYVEVAVMTGPGPAGFLLRTTVTRSGRIVDPFTARVQVMGQRYWADAPVALDSTGVTTRRSLFDAVAAELAPDVWREVRRDILMERGVLIGVLSAAPDPDGRGLILETRGVYGRIHVHVTWDGRITDAYPADHHGDRLTSPTFDEHRRTMFDHDLGAGDVTFLTRFMTALNDRTANITGLRATQPTPA